MIRLYSMSAAAAVLALLPAHAAQRGPGRRKRFARVNPVFASAVRPRLLLDGEWAFALDPKDEGDRAGWGTGKGPFKDSIRVPGAWEAQGFGGPRLTLRYQGTPVHLRGSYRGAAWYRKTVRIPDDWKGRRLWLKFGGVNPAADVWCNGAYLGSHARYFEPFKFEVTDLARPGKPCTVAVRIDNREQAEGFGQGGGQGGCLTIVWPWGGIHRSVVLEAAAPVSIQRAVILPDLDRSTVELRVELEDDPPATARLELDAEARLIGDGAEESFGKLSVPVSQRSFSLSLPISTVRPWSPALPRLYRLDLRLSDKGKLLDQWAERFGFCRREVRGNDVFLNNRQAFIRAYGNDCVYPLTIAPPASREFYRKRFRQARAFGFTYARHHTWVPPREYFDAADETGIMLQPELPYGGPVERLDALIANYRNHPSLATYSMTNEAYRGKEMLAKLYQRAKALDPSRFAIDSDGVGGPVRPTADLWIITGTPPDSAPAFRTKPVIYHEFLNLPTITDPASRHRFTGGFIPVAKENLAAYAKAKGLEEEVRQAVRASRYLQRLYQKEGIERARSQRELDGYCYWTIADFWEFGQGLFDMLWEPKGWTWREFRQFNGPACILAKLPAATAWHGERIRVAFSLSNYDGRDIRDGTLEWKLTEGTTVLARGLIADVDAPHGSVSPAGAIDLDLPGLGRHARLVLHVELPWSKFWLRNQWELWTFSKAALAKELPARIRFRGRAKALAATCPEGKAEAERELLVAETLQPADLELLRGGGRVLLTTTRSFDGLRAKLHPGWWRPHAGNQVGLAMRRHPALSGFPHDGAAGSQVRPLLRSVVCIDKLPFKVTPIVYGLSYPFPRMPMHLKKPRGEPPELRACLFEFPVGKGMVLVCGLDLSADRPEARALLDCLVRYAAGPDFQAKGEDGTAALERLTPSIRHLAIARRLDPPKVRPGDPATVELHVANRGALPCDVTVSDAVPPGVDIAEVAGKPVRSFRRSVTLRGGEGRTLSYTVRADKTGRYTLPPARLVLGKESTQSRPTVLTVAADAPPRQLPKLPRVDPTPRDARRRGDARVAHGRGGASPLQPPHLELPRAERRRRTTTRSTSAARSR